MMLSNHDDYRELGSVHTVLVSEVCIAAALQNLLVIIKGFMLATLYCYFK